MRFVQWWRTVGVSSTTGAYEIYDLSGSDDRARTEPAAFAVGVQFLPARLRAAEHRDRHGRQTGAGIPAAQRDHGRGLLNFLHWVTRNGYNDVSPTYADLLPIAHDVPQVVDWLNLRLTANQLSQIRSR